MNADFVPFNSCVYIDQEIIKNEYEYYYGSRKNVKVRFFYYNFKRDRVHEIKGMNYYDALALALMRRRDGRYKNYEFYIQL